MKKSLKKVFVMLLAVAVLVTCSNVKVANAETLYYVPSTGGTNGVMYYNLSTSDETYYIGTQMYRLTASSTQVLYGIFSAYVPISSIDYQATIYLEAGGISTSSGSFTYRDASWSSNGVAESAVTSAREKGCITHSITSLYYGSINKTLTNE